MVESVETLFISESWVGRVELDMLESAVGVLVLICIVGATDGAGIGLIRPHAPEVVVV